MLPVSLAEAAQRCGLKSSLAHRTRLAITGGLPIHRLGRGAYYVLENDLQNYINKVGVGHLTGGRDNARRAA